MSSAVEQHERRDQALASHSHEGMYQDVPFKWEVMNDSCISSLHVCQLPDAYTYQLTQREKGGTPREMKEEGRREKDDRGG